MVISKINPILDITQSITQYPPEVVSGVIKHAFGALKIFLINPTNVAIRLPHLGALRPNIKAINQYIRNTLIPKLRVNRNDEEVLMLFKQLWALKQAAIKDKQRRDFKNRFGSWHYKRKE